MTTRGIARGAARLLAAAWVAAIGTIAVPAVFSEQVLQASHVGGSGLATFTDNTAALPGDVRCCANEVMQAAVETYTRLDVEQRGPVVIGRFHNPPRHVMDPITVADLFDLLHWVETEDDIRVLVLTGSAPDVFIAGFDTRHLGTTHFGDPEISKDGTLPEPTAMHRALLMMEAISKPVIAALNGRTVGGGLETALAADFRFAAEDAVISLPEVRIGIIPGGGGTARLPRLIGPARAMELIMLGTPITGAEAERLGLVNRAVPADRLMDEVMEFANELARRPAHSLAAVKRSFREGRHLPLDQAILIEQDAYYKTLRESGRR